MRTKANFKRNEKTWQEFVRAVTRGTLSHTTINDKFLIFFKSTKVSFVYSSTKELQNLQIKVVHHDRESSQNILSCLKMYKKWDNHLSCLLIWTFFSVSIEILYRNSSKQRSQYRSIDDFSSFMTFMTQLCCWRLSVLAKGVVYYFAILKIIKIVCLPFVKLGVSRHSFGVVRSSEVCKLIRSIRMGDGISITCLSYFCKLISISILIYFDSKKE